MSDYDWTEAALRRIRAAVLARAGLPRHAFTRVYLDAPSLQPERIPAHRAPRHRADMAVDSCRLGRALGRDACRVHAGGNLKPLEGRHRADVAA